MNFYSLLFLISSLFNLSLTINLINQDDQLIKQLNLQSTKSPTNFDLLTLNRNSDLELNNRDLVNYLNRNYELANKNYDLSSFNKNLDLSSLISKNYDIYSLLNNRNQIDLSALNNYKYLDAPVSSSNLLLSRNNNTISPKNLQPFINTADLWRLIQKLRIGSLFSTKNTRSNAGNNDCQCPQASEKQKPTFIPMPIPVVERIHHIHHDRQSTFDNIGNQMEFTKYLKNLNDVKYSSEFRSPYNLNGFKQPLDLKNQFNLNYDLNKLPLHMNEQSIRKEILDRARFNMNLYNNQLINGRSINNVKTFNPLINHDIYQQNLHNLPLLNRDQTLMQPIYNNLYLDNNKNRQLMSDLNKDESSLTSLDDGVGTNLDARKDEFNPTKILNEISQLLLNDMENSPQHDSSKMKILKLLSDLEKYLLSQKNRWSTRLDDKQDVRQQDDKQQDNKQNNRLNNKLDDRLDKLQIDKFNSARFNDNKLNFDKSDFNKQIDDKLNYYDKSNDTNWFVSNNDYLMNNLLNSDSKIINESIDTKFNRSLNNFKKPTSKKKKKIQTSNDDWSLDDEYFTDYLPSETELKKTIDDFQPIINYQINPIKIVKKLSNKSNNQTIDNKISIKNDTIKLIGKN